MKVLGGTSTAGKEPCVSSSRTWFKIELSRNKASGLKPVKSREQECRKENGDLAERLGRRRRRAVAGFGLAWQTLASGQAIDDA